MFMYPHQQSLQYILQFCAVSGNIQYFCVCLCRFLLKYADLESSSYLFNSPIVCRIIVVSIRKYPYV